MDGFKWGDRQHVIAISQLGGEANWVGFPQCVPGSWAGDAIYQPPPGWAILQSQTIVHTNNNGGAEVSVIAGGGKFISQIDMDTAYNLVMAMAYKDGKNDVAAELKQQYDQHIKDLRMYESNKNTVHAHVSCAAHGSCVDQQGGSIRISVEANLLYIGEPNSGMLIRALLETYGLTASPLNNTNSVAS